MKGKPYTNKFKEQVLREVEDTGNMTLVARNHNIPSTTINTWVKKGQNNVKNNVKNTSTRGPKWSSFSSNNHNKETEKENETLKKILGEKNLEIAILKGLLKK